MCLIFLFFFKLLFLSICWFLGRFVCYFKLYYIRLEIGIGSDGFDGIVVDLIFGFFYKGDMNFMKF